MPEERTSTTMTGAMTRRELEQATAEAVLWILDRTCIFGPGHSESRDRLRAALTGYRSARGIDK